MVLRNIFKERFLRQSESKGGQSTQQSAKNQVQTTNTNPPDVEEYSIPLVDDQFFQINIAALFPLSSLPLQDFCGEDLPQWAQINVATGMITGTVSHDASVFGRSKVLVTAIDKHEHEVALTVILCPQNLAAIADITVHDCEIAEQSSFELSLEPLFYDPFSAIEPTTICVSGLPRGLEFNPEHNSISGETLQQTANRAPYVVTVWAHGVQNKLIRQHFLLKVTPSDQQQPEVSKGSDVDDRRAEIRAANLAKLRNSFVAKSSHLQTEVQFAESVRDRGEINGDWEIKMPKHAELQSASSMIPEKSEIDWTETETSLKQKYKREVLDHDDRLNRITIDALRRQNKLYLEFQNSLDATRDGRVTRASIRGQDGAPLPEWMRMVREDFVTASPPPNVRSVDLELSVELGNGNRLVKPVRVEF